MVIVSSWFVYYVARLVVSIDIDIYLFSTSIYEKYGNLERTAMEGKECNGRKGKERENKEETRKDINEEPLRREKKRNETNKKTKKPN